MWIYSYIVSVIVPTEMFQIPKFILTHKGPKHSIPAYTWRQSSYIHIYIYINTWPILLCKRTVWARHDRGCSPQATAHPIHKKLLLLIYTGDYKDIRASAYWWKITSTALASSDNMDSLPEYAARNSPVQICQERWAPFLRTKERRGEQGSYGNNN